MDLSRRATGNHKDAPRAMNLRSRCQIRVVGCCLAVCSMAWLVGCGARGPKYPSAQLEGTVVVNRQQLAEGSIQFLPQGRGQAAAVSGTVKEGRYKATGVPLGDVLVVFTAIRKTHELPPDKTGRKKWATENLIPERSRGGVTIKVTAGQTSQDFTL